MAKYIEMVGTAGVGKTTTYNYLHKMRPGRGKVLFYEDLDVIGNKILKPKFLLRKLGLSGPVAPVEIRDYSREFAKKNRSLMDLFWEALLSVSSNTEPDIRFHRVNYLKKIIYKIQRIKEHPSEAYFILDEGFIHNFHYFTGMGSEKDLETLIIKILKRTEPPAGIIFFEANAEIIMKRTLNRKKKLGRDMSLSHEELVKTKQEEVKQWERCTAILESLKIPVLHLKPLEAVRLKAQSVNDFILHLENKNFNKEIAK